MSERQMDYIRSILLDFSATITLCVFLLQKSFLVLASIGFDPAYIPLIGTIGAALTGAVVGRLLDWTKDYYLKRRARRRPSIRPRKPFK